jgi:hypothetical protein
LKPPAEVSWVGLQFGPDRDQLRTTRVPVLDWGAQINDFHDMASAMVACDLVITIDSAPAHLAGALGVPVWTLLHNRSVGDWRWSAHRGSSTPWYPTMRLFWRSRGEASWRPVFARVAEALQAEVASRERVPA